ncbi:MAG: S8/S53 family peptidase [Meiothermus sp.]|nr:S8/S53 family peptidase [Meiothermus sp.]
MYKNWFGAALVVVLSACGSSTLEALPAEALKQEAGVSAAALMTNVAWNERVELAVPSNFPVTVRYGTLTLPVVSRSNGKVVFDLPPAPPAPSLSAAASVDVNTYLTTPTSTELNAYANRGTVLVQVFRNSNNSLVASQDYQPLGSVEPGELTVLGPPASNGQCLNLPAGFSNVEGPFKYTVGDQAVCLRTVRFTSAGTQQALGIYAAARPTQSVDRNTVSSLDPSGAGSFDPSCEQIEKWLNPLTSGNFFNLTAPNYQAASNANNRGSLDGTNIRVHVMGSGLGVNDKIQCAASVNFVDHDNHIESLIKLLAPAVSTFEKKVCDDNGNCPASSVARGLLEIGQSASAAPNLRNDIVNLSLGAPLSSTAVYGALKAMENDVLVVASSGNHPFADNHFPAGYAQGLGNVSLPLANVVAVAGTGLDNASNTWRVAGYNTRQNANLFAAGANLCPTTALGFRCIVGGNPLLYQDVGISGSSFAAPGVTGIAALYLQQSGRTLGPAALKTCLETKSNLNPVFNGGASSNGMVWYDPAGC